MVLAGIILAAGASQRMGTPKALLPWGGRTFFEEGINALECADVSVKAAVVSPALRPRLPGLNRLQSVLENPHPESGQLGSLQIALRDLRDRHPEAAGTFVLLVDNPGDLAYRLRTLIRRLGSEPNTVLSAGFAGNFGHPTYLPRASWESVLAWTGEDGLRGWMESESFPVLLVETGMASALNDIDTPDDYEAALTAAN